MNTTRLADITPTTLTIDQYTAVARLATPEGRHNLDGLAILQALWAEGYDTVGMLDLAYLDLAKRYRVLQQAAAALRDEVVAYHEPPCAFHRPDAKGEIRQSCRCCRAIVAFDHTTTELDQEPNP